MESLKNLMGKIDPKNPSDFDIRLISLKNYYVSLKKKKDIKKLRRLKLLLYMYPKMLERNNFRSIEMVVEDPADRTLWVRDKEHMSAVEYRLANKLFNGRFSPDSLKIMFRVSDFYDYFGKKKKKS